MTRRDAFLLLALGSTLLFFLLLLFWTFSHHQRVKSVLRGEVVAQALLIREQLKFAETRLSREEILNLVNQFNRDSLKVNLIPKPISHFTFTEKRFPNDPKTWCVAGVPISLKNFSGQLEVARPFTYQGPSFFIYLFIFFALSITGAFLLAYFSGRRLKEFISAFRGERNIWQKFLSAPEEVGEIARIAWEKEEKSEETIGKLKEKEQSITSLVGIIKDPCFILDEKRSFLYANPSFLRLCGVDEFSLLSRSALTLFLKRGEVEKFVELVFQKGEVSKYELELDKEFYSAQGKTFFLEGKGTRAVCVLNRITERKRWEEAKQELVTAIAHELKTPLTAIKGAVETLEEQVRGKSRQFLSLIGAHTERLAEITNNLLTLSRLEEMEKGSVPLSLTDVNLRVILKNVLNLFSFACKKKRIRTKLILPKEDLVVKGDSYFLEQAFINLMDNAVKYTEKGKIEIKLIQGLDYVEISFSDTGIGIPPEDLDKIFERFYVVDKSRSQKFGGSGLGLAIVKHIVNLHKGKVEVKSELGKGSTFTVFLPRS
uniref:histidine kinase n=1 Tax=candidate division WOR-3 bacterium TaxID=2052148 RepID=A0A7C3UU96_UNCW3